MTGEDNDIQATFCATLIDEWIHLGVRHAVVAPGSRSTPLALAVASRDELAVHVVHDERSAAFVALGLGVGAGPFGEPSDRMAGSAAPALLICTSGTAAANFYPAVVEAGLSAVPLLVLTADRPEELRGVGAPQTIDQLELYGNHVRWFHDPGVAEATASAEWRRLAARAFSAAVDGPVQLNLPFREPLLGTARDLPPRTDSQSPAGVADRSGDPLPESFDRQRGVILAGGRSGVSADDVGALAAMTEWPIIADPLSGMRHLPGSVTTADALLRHPRFAADHAPEVVVRIGRPATSKALAQWAARAEIVVQVGGPGRIDPERNVVATCAMETVLAARPTGATGTTWRARWSHADGRAADAIDRALSLDAGLTEPGAVRAVADHLPHGAVLTVASSMPVRDLEWYGGRAAAAFANRGANGIDGVTSTALGRALAGAPSVLLIGDLAFVHDVNALVGLARRDADLRIVVIDNDGGGIFSFLPQSAALGHDRFEQLFGTPLGADVVGLARAHGVPASTVTAADQLISRLAEPGPWVVRVPSDRTANVAVHERLVAAVAAALDAP